VKLNLGRALKFWTVGAFGAVIQSVAFYAFTRYLGVPDFVVVAGVIEVPWALGWAIVLAAVSNYVFNELWTWREPRQDQAKRAGLPQPAERREPESESVAQGRME
jgi:putative flippase GtrA